MTALDEGENGKPDSAEDKRRLREAEHNEHQRECRDDDLHPQRSRQHQAADQRNRRRHAPDIGVAEDRLVTQQIPSPGVVVPDQPRYVAADQLIERGGETDENHDEPKDD
jgi:hypothetical protein